MTVIMNGNTIGLLDSLIRNEKNSKRAGEGNKKRYIRNPCTIETTFFISLKRKATPRKKYVY